jgi:integrase
VGRLRVTGWRDGKPVRKKVSASSKAGATAKLRKLDEELDQGLVTTGRPLTVEKWMTYWLEEVVTKKNRPNTQRTYRTYVTRYIVPLLGHHRIDRLSPEHIDEAWQHLMTVGCPGKDNPKPLSTTSAHQAHVILSRALKVAMARGHVSAQRRHLRRRALGPQPADRGARQGQAAASSPQPRQAERRPVHRRVLPRPTPRRGARTPLVRRRPRRGLLTVRHSLDRVTGVGLRLGPTKSGRERAHRQIPKPLLAELKAHRLAQNAERLAAGSWWVDGDYVFAKPDGRPIDGKDDWRAVAGAARRGRRPARPAPRGTAHRGDDAARARCAREGRLRDPRSHQVQHHRGLPAPGRRPARDAAAKLAAAWWD